MAYWISRERFMDGVRDILPLMRAVAAKQESVPLHFNEGTDPSAAAHYVRSILDRTTWDTYPGQEPADRTLKEVVSVSIKSGIVILTPRKKRLPRSARNEATRVEKAPGLEEGIRTIEEVSGYAPGDGAVQFLSIGELGQQIMRERAEALGLLIQFEQKKGKTEVTIDKPRKES